MLSLRAMPTLRAAARDFGRLTEVSDARHLMASGDTLGALRNLRRAAQVVEAVPMPQLRLAAAGALAQAQRASGLLSDEARTWAAAMEATSGSGEAALRLHALNGATACALHRGQPAAALEHCDTAHAAACDLPVPWRSTFELHQSLALFQLAPADDEAATTTNTIRELVQSTAAAEASSNDVEVQQTLISCAEGTRLLMGDVLILNGENGAARDCWQSLLPCGDVEQAQAGQVTVAAEYAHINRQIATLWRLGRVQLATGSVSDARSTLASAVDLCDEHAPWLLPTALGDLAKVLTADGEFVAAEGLLRSAVDGVMRGQATTPVEAAYLMPALQGYADLLRRLETNGKPRLAEAANVSGVIAALLEAHPEVLQAGREWRGLESWYSQSCEVDWLEECRLEGE
mmetsp:Transcript_6567/g.17011  ORF Transcript_6567/g.17011 Transcript_6567/m.17011 type:complete len:403 (-) Transcript_6567:304-1512(-)